VGSSVRHRGELYSLLDDFDCYRCYDPNSCPVDGEENSLRDVESAAQFPVDVNAGPRHLTPALAIFDSQQAERGVVFRTNHPVLTAPECRKVVNIVNSHHEDVCLGQWSTVRHSSVKTTDVAVESVPLLREWLLALMYTRLNDMLAFLFPVFADGSTMYTQETPPRSRIRIHDAFIVRYDAEKDGSLSLPEHCDTSAVSVVLSLNSAAAGDYVGGGTWFEALGEKGEGQCLLRSLRVVCAELSYCYVHQDWL
jgi:hypothetical protein